MAKNESKPKRGIVSVVFSPSELARMKRAAAKDQRPVGPFVRLKAIQKLDLEGVK